MKNDTRKAQGSLEKSRKSLKKGSRKAEGSLEKSRNSFGKLRRKACLEFSVEKEGMPMLSCGSKIDLMEMQAMHHILCKLRVAGS